MRMLPKYRISAYAKLFAYFWVLVGVPRFNTLLAVNSRWSVVIFLLRVEANNVFIELPVGIGLIILSRIRGVVPCLADIRYRYYSPVPIPTKEEIIRENYFYVMALIFFGKPGRDIFGLLFSHLNSYAENFPLASSIQSISCC